MYSRFRERPDTDYIVVHCSATPPSADIGLKEITALHAGPKGTYVEWNGEQIECFGWEAEGYHHIIRRNGALESGRPTLTIGAHAKGYNSKSVGICLVGGIQEGDIYAPDANFTKNQYATLERVVKQSKRLYHFAEVLGHRDLPGVKKACPCFDVRAWWDDK